MLLKQERPEMDDFERRKNFVCCLGKKLFKMFLKKSLRKKLEKLRKWGGGVAYLPPPIFTKN